ncbi:hypothetical protein H9649_06565 [Sporosarcina sp. Sa2YVA2]|uniref:VWFA domain-containing protein n=1 Tax=Sporosarcina quadrami TaxID=2762234 RepID=A0ABR8U865_9BACL|nr:VWA domain-containing protein [Sporosarcina quadrami]MBD7984235.1 hypothetical protein [Sporosarcina quadrami]
MNRFVFLLIIFLCMIIAGCSQDKEKQNTQTESDGVEKELNASTNDVDNPSDGEAGTENTSASTLITDFLDVEPAQTVEEIASMPPGQLTKDFTIEKETSMWNTIEVPKEIREEFLLETKPIIQSTNDPEVIYRSIMHLLGGAKYEELVSPFITYSPSFAEPILPEPYEITEGGKEVTQPAKALILLDASSSMLLQADGRLKMDTAKIAVKSFAMTVGKESEVSLYVYGHKGTQNKSDKELSCGTIEEVYPLGKYAEKKFNEAVDDVKANGWTPLAEAIKQARLDHENTTDDITVYIVSDGAETCGGDPVAEAKAFSELAKDRHVNVIGFQVDKEAESQLKAVAEAGNGTYMAADSLEEMTVGISKMWFPSDLDLVSLVYASPIGWPEAMALKKVLDYASNSKKAIQVENERFIGAARLLQEEGLIDKDMMDSVLKHITHQKETYDELIGELETEKRQLVDDEVKRIVTKIEDYQARVRTLKEENKE